MALPWWRTSPTHHDCVLRKRKALAQPCRAPTRWGLSHQRRDHDRRAMPIRRGIPPADLRRAYRRECASTRIPLIQTPTAMPSGWPVTCHAVRSIQPFEILLELRASQINGCAFCLELHSTGRHADVARKLELLAGWREVPEFSSKERAALALTEEMVRIGDGGGVNDDTWARVRTEFGDDEIAGLLYTIGLIGLWNVINVAVEFPAGAQLPTVPSGPASRSSAITGAGAVQRGAAQRRP